MGGPGGIDRVAATAFDRVAARAPEQAPALARGEILGDRRREPMIADTVTFGLNGDRCRSSIGFVANGALGSRSAAGCGEIG